MKKTTVEVLRNTQGETTTVEGYEIEPGWVVHHTVGFSRSWTITHVESGRALLQHAPTRGFAIRMFNECKENGALDRLIEREAIARMLEKEYA